MKIALISTGIEQRNLRLQPHHTLLDMTRQLVKLGHKAVLISDGATNLPEQAEVTGLPLWRVPSVRMFRRQHNAALVSAITQQAPDLVLWHLSLSSFLHQNLEYNLPQPVIGIFTSPIHRVRDFLRLGPAKLSSNLDLVAPNLLGILVPSRLIHNAFMPGRLQGMITLSESARQYLVHNGAPAERVWVVPPGVDPVWLENGNLEETQRKIRRQFGFHDADFVVTYFGSPAPVRGIWTMLEAVKVAIQAYSHLRLLILSRRWLDEWGRQTARLKDFVERDGFKECISVVDGYLERQTLIQHVAASDAVCLPFELLPSDVPLSVLEAMALKKGVITTSIACIPELVGSNRGFLIPPTSVSSLVHQLHEIIDKPEMLEAHGQKARAFIEKYRTLDCMGQTLESVLKTAHSEYERLAS